MSDDRAAKRERKAAEEQERRSNPLGILCLHCGELCYLYEWQEGKRTKERWMCHDERHN